MTSGNNLDFLFEMLTSQHIRQAAFPKSCAWLALSSLIQLKISNLITGRLGHLKASSKPNHFIIL